MCDVQKYISTDTFMTEKLELIYEPKGTEGQKTEDGWTILYDNGETAEAVSPTAMGELRLGHSEEASTNEEKLTQAITSYNTAITLINNYCKILEGLPENKGVRSVGASTETSDEYYSDIIKTWNSAYNGVGKKGDIKYEQDLVRMAYWGVLDGESAYWMASRIISDGTGSYVDFGVRYVDFDSSEQFSAYALWGVNNSKVYGIRRTCAVRPVITIENL